LNGTKPLYVDEVQESITNIITKTNFVHQKKPYCIQPDHA